MRPWLLSSLTLLAACSSEPIVFSGTTSTSSTGGSGAGGSATAGSGLGGSGAQGGTGGSMFCVPGETASCYTGPAGTAGVGLCLPGVQVCLADGSAFGPCTGEVTPAGEVCATPGDDDCDGAANEEGPDCSCAPGSQSACYSGPPATEGVGPCHGGTQQCNAAGTGYGPCTGEVIPALETCNTAVDDDCDGAVNESGAGCVCVPGSSADCYTGPPGTENVGACAAGTHDCNAMGTAYGPCSGEVTPQQDACATAADEDCNGSPVPCVSEPGWSKSYGAPNQNNNPAAIAVDAAGNVFLAFQAANIDLGNGAVNGAALVKLSASGTVLWTRVAGPIASPFDVAVDPAGNVVLGGSFMGNVDFGGGSFVTPQNTFEAFVVKYDALGNHVWSTHYGTGSPGQLVSAYAVGSDLAGNVLVGGTFAGGVDFGGGQFIPANNNGDLFVLKLSPNGAHVWSKRGNSLGGNVRSIGADAAGNVSVAGYFSGSLNLGGMDSLAAGSGDFFAARLSPAGAVLYQRAFGNSANQIECAAAVDAAGNVVLGGNMEGTIDFGGGPLVGLSNLDAFLVKLDATGNHVWSKSFGNGQFQNGRGVAFAPSGDVLFTGSFQSMVNFGGASLVSAGSHDAFVVRYTSAGAPVWAKRFGDVGYQTGWDLATDSVGAVLVAGAFWFKSTIDLGQGPLQGLGETDTFVAKLPP